MRWLLSERSAHLCQASTLVANGNCRACLLAAQNAYLDRDDNRVRSNESMKRLWWEPYRHDPEFMEANRIYERQRIRADQTARPEYYAFHSILRHARKLRATPDWLTDVQLAEIQAFYDEAKRLTEVTGLMHHVDHIVPLCSKNVCGLHVPWNLQVITADANRKKSNNFDGNW